MFCAGFVSVTVIYLELNDATCTHEVIWKYTVL